MEATWTYTIAISTTQKAKKKANSVINAIYEGYVIPPVVVQPFSMPNIRHVYVLLPFVTSHIRHAHLDLYVGG